jgi:3-deoxy-D-manno-octulosonate 8-phosphate phosphatase (KDO 8-P phosphatase)
MTDFEFTLSLIKLIVYDFDGVMTNNKVLLNQFGIESVFVNRSDGLAINRIKKLGIRQLIISTEKNPIVRKRAGKLHIALMHGIKDKKKSLAKYCIKNKIDLNQVIYIGNDINDLEVMECVGYPLCPQDAYDEIKRISKLILKTCGGDGVIRELLSIIDSNHNKKLEE